jgi:N-acetylneuraminate synthase
MTRSIKIGGRLISQGGRPYIIAEIGVNHGGSMEQAQRLIELAKEGGADAAKFQSYKAETLASTHSPAYWDTTKEKTLSQRELFKKYDGFGPQEYIALAEHCKNVGIEFLSTPFDDAAIDFLEPLVSLYKIASADLTNIPFLRKIARKGKPIVLSTGASTLGEIDIAVSELVQAGCKEIALLHCVLNYPTANADAHLAMIRGLQRAYPDLMIGYSDHTLPDEAMTTLVTAYLLGAQIIEKHFTHDKSLPGNDHYHAMDVVDLARFVELSGRIETLLGDAEHKAPLETEKPARKHARRSIVLSRALPGGHVITADDLTYKRPGGGISPLHWDDVVGRTTAHALEEDHVLRWDDLAATDR